VLGVIDWSIAADAITRSPDHPVARF